MAIRPPPNIPPTAADQYVNGVSIPAILKTATAALTATAQHAPTTIGFDDLIIDVG
jgi:hypothetical protein